MRQSIIVGLTIAIVSWISLSARAETIVYDNMTNPWGYEPGGVGLVTLSGVSPEIMIDVGDTVNLGGTARIGKKLEVVVVPSLGAPVTSNVVLSLYDNTGAGGAPNNLLWRKDFGQITLPFGLNILSADLNDVQLPDTVTWTVQCESDGFASGSTKLSLAMYNPPSIGTSNELSFWAGYGDYQYWFPMSSEFGMANMGARITAEVPEPASIGILGVILTAMYGWRRRVVSRLFYTSL